MIDNQSPAGAWKEAMARAPWAYGQSQSNKVEEAFVKMRERGLWDEAATLQQEILTLKREIEWLREKK